LKWKLSEWRTNAVFSVQFAIKEGSAPDEVRSSERNGRLKYSVRLLALASTTVCAIFLLYNVLKLFVGYNYKHHRFAPGIVSLRDFLITALLAVGCLCAAILYRKLARSTEPVLK
jgi:hypothetical protein